MFLIKTTVQFALAIIHSLKYWLAAINYYQRLYMNSEKSSTGINEGDASENKKAQQKMLDFFDTTSGNKGLSTVTLESRMALSL